MKKIVAATPSDTSSGFGLAGIRQIVTCASELGELVQLLALDPATGVVMVDERLIGNAAQETLAAIDRQWPGLVVVLPAPAVAPPQEEDYALRMVRRAIGYQVRLNV